LSNWWILFPGNAELHLRVLERARIVRCVRAGRESLFELDPKAIDEMKAYLERVSAHWDAALGRLRWFVEEVIGLMISVGA
jgi:DNA-binding transcriptional ArsR family regulator